MTGMLIAVFVTSLLGSSHCAGMCGPFVILVGGKQQRPAYQLSSLLMLYHLGRLFAYTLLGMLAGLLGYGLHGFGDLVGIRPYVIPLSGLILVIYGCLSFLMHSQAGHSSLGFGTSSLTKLMSRIIKAGYRASARWPDTLRAASIGFYSGFLPCGWLYTFLMMAVTTGSLVSGGSVLFVFWLGTLPALTALVFGVRYLGDWLRLRTVEISSVACIVFGILMMGAQSEFCCHGVPSVPAVASPTATTVLSIPVHSIPDCCHR